jgi:hypothetical protein
MRLVGFSAWILVLGGAVAVGGIGACGNGGGGTSTTQSSQHSSSGQGGGGGAGGSSAGGAGGGVSAKQACTDYAKARCTRLGTCSNGFQIALKYGDENTCEFRTEQACEAALLSADNGETGDDVEACTAAIPSQSCVDILDNQPPAACAPMKGTRGTNDGCGTPWQCKTAWCEIDRFTTCGSCSAVPLAGSQCLDDTECGAGLVCFKNFCATPGAASDACDHKTKPCLAGLTCVGATSTTSGTCQTAGDTKGVGCDPSGMAGPGCDDSIGLYCHPTIKKCEHVVLVDAGQPCGVVKNHVVACKDAGKCQTPMGMNMGTCQAAAGDTQPCDLMAGPGCQPPAKCVTDGQNPAGTCTFPDPGVCMK